MSYKEQDGQVILTLSREDYDALLIRLGAAAAVMISQGGSVDRELGFINVLNAGNPNYTPYRVSEKPHSGQ
jgi:hypothetical protein